MNTNPIRAALARLTRRDVRPLAERIRARMAEQPDDIPMSDDLVRQIADVLAGAR